MQTTEPSTTRVQESRGIRRWLGAAAAGVILVGGVLLASLSGGTPTTDEPPIAPSAPSTTLLSYHVQVVQSFASAVAANDFEAASEHVNSQVWDDRHRNLLGYWESLGAHLELSECFLSDGFAEVTCVAKMRGAHYPADSESSQSFVAEAGRGVTTPMEYEADVDHQLYAYAAAQDPAGAEEACSVSSDEAESVFSTDDGLSYKPSCGAFLADHIEGWMLES